MSTPTMENAAEVLADPSAYADEPRLHAALTHLRHTTGVLVDLAPYRPFWRSPNTLTSWRSSAPTRCGSTSRARCWCLPNSTI